MTKKRVVSRRTFVDPDKVGKTRPRGSARTVVVKTQESLWDCTSCGTTGIRGRDKICPNCGNTKDADEQYREPSTDAPVLTRHELDLMGVDENHYSDETCEFCGSKNKPGTQKCTQCGSSLVDVARTDRVCDNCGRETSEGTCPNCGGATRLKSESLYQQPVQAYRPTTSYSIPSGKLNVGLDFTDPRVWGPVLGLLVIALLTFIFWPRQAEVQVQSVGWKAEVFLQEYQYNKHEGWSLPAGADLVSTEQKEHHTVQVQQGTKTEHYTENVCGPDVYDYTEVVTYDDGTTDTIDHYKPNCWDEPRTREVPNMVDQPVYETWYTYMQWEWVSIAPAVTTGSDYAPYWPTDFRIDEKHRESGRKMSFSVYLVELGDGDDFTYHPDSLDEYKSFNINSMWQITHSGGIVTEIKRIER